MRLLVRVQDLAFECDCSLLAGRCYVARRGGTGLGLALCKHFIETGHSGLIGATSQLGLGSEFFFVVPLTAEAALSEASAVSAPIREDHAQCHGALMTTSSGTRPPCAAAMRRNSGQTLCKVLMAPMMCSCCWCRQRRRAR